MRTKKDKEKPSSASSQRHSSAANYEIGQPVNVLQDLPDKEVLELFEKMLVRKMIKICKVSYFKTFLQV